MTLIVTLPRTQYRSMMPGPPAEIDWTGMYAIVSYIATGTPDVNSRHMSQLQTSQGGTVGKY